MTSSSLPTNLLEAWEKAVLAHSPRCRDFRSALELHAPSLRQIWKSYTSERGALGRLPATDPRFVGPYLLGFHLSNFVRTHGLVTRALERGVRVPTGDQPARIIDLGAGTGAGAQAIGFALKERGIAFQVELVDRSRHLVHCARSMHRDLFANSPVRSLSRSLFDPAAHHLMDKWRHSPARLNILHLGFVWNELSRQPRLRGELLVQLELWAKTSRPTWLLVVEPAAEMGARSAQKLREHLIGQGWEVTYPCPISGRCPMGTNGKDWCYSEFNFTPSPRMSEVRRVLNVSRQRLGSAAYFFVNSAAGVADRSPSGAVMVGRPLMGQNSHLLVCRGDRLERRRDQPTRLRGESL